LAELDKYESGKEARKTKKELLAKKIEKIETKMQQIQTKDELLELAQINDRIEELSKNVKRELRHLEKPLLKFQTLVNNPGYSLFPEANMKLEEYLNAPFEALATEKEGYPLLVNILQKIDSALDNKKMKLKSSRLRKAKDQINRIVNKNGLSKLHNDCAKTFTKKSKLAKSGIISESKDKRAKLRERLKDLQRRLIIIEARDDRLTKDHEQMRKRVVEQKKSLENLAFELSNKTINLILSNEI
jgi:methylase of polypeptide subunit release factors